MGQSPGLWTQIRRLASLVRLSHTVFGLPFCVAAAALADRSATALGRDGLDLARGALIVLAFTGARTAAMAFNRLVDRELDARNPRTSGRELPTGALSPASAWALAVVSAAVFVGAAGALGPLPLVLSPACLLIVLGYSFFKRFSWSSHLVLGLALALAPGGAWIAVTGGVEGWPVATALMVAVATWVAGFDILYSLQDEQFDRQNALHSIPARFGTRAALVLSAWLHVGTVAALVGLHMLAGLSAVHAAGVAGLAAILAWEHAIVRPGDLSRIDRAFFDLNGWASVAYLACTLTDVYVWPG